MLENSWYTVISPENCSSILWRSWDQKEKAAEELRLTPDNMYGFGLIDGIVPEPIGGAHWDYNEAAALLKPKLIKTIQELYKMSPEERINKRIGKFSKMGFFDEYTDMPDVIHHGDPEHPEPEPEINESIPVNHE